MLKTICTATLSLLAAAALSTASAAFAAPTIQTATVTRVEERQSLNLSAYGTTEDAMRDIRRSSRSGHLGALPTERIYAVRAKTPAGKTIELTAKGGSAPHNGDSVQYDEQSREIVR